MDFVVGIALLFATARCPELGLNPLEELVDEGSTGDVTRHDEGRSGTRGRRLLELRLRCGM